MEKPKAKGGCSDKNCPIHGNLIPRGREFNGTVIAKDVHGTATVEFDRRVSVKKYERYAKKRTRLRVHNPECINAGIGDLVKVTECKPLSKTKNSVIVEKTGKDVLYQQKAEALEEGKAPEEKEEKRESEETEAADKKKAEQPQEKPGKGQDKSSQDGKDEEQSAGSQGDATEEDEAEPEDKKGEE
ncbi:30S ribosomal protein S17 [Candidatus Woesearchaeota archaeon]|nr:30S ribosomal protein S17 [Candidatus Woesearchaeota archaeon]